MKVIVGLGNPGAQYERTRHNVGFRVVDRLANKWGWSWNERRGKAILASGTVGSEKVVLAKPLTYMNLSGEAVGELIRWYKIAPSDLLVIYDELDLPNGKVKLLGAGNAGGHNGMRDILTKLHTNAFPRLRIGIGRSQNNNMAGKDYVLSAASGDDGIILSSAEERAVEAVELLLRQGLATSMNVVNTDPEEAARKAEEQARKAEEQARKKEERERKKKAEAEELAKKKEGHPPDEKSNEN